MKEKILDKAIESSNKYIEKYESVEVENLNKMQSEKLIGMKKLNQLLQNKLN